MIFQQQKKLRECSSTRTGTHKRNHWENNKFAVQAVGQTRFSSLRLFLKKFREFSNKFALQFKIQSVIRSVIQFIWSIIFICKSRSKEVPNCKWTPLILLYRHLKHFFRTYFAKNTMCATELSYFETWPMYSVRLVILS